MRLMTAAAAAEGTQRYERGLGPCSSWKGRRFFICRGLGCPFQPGSCKERQCSPCMPGLSAAVYWGEGELLPGPAIPGQVPVELLCSWAAAACSLKDSPVLLSSLYAVWSGGLGDRHERGRQRDPQWFISSPLAAMLPMRMLSLQLTSPSVQLFYLAVRERTCSAAHAAGLVGVPLGKDSINKPLPAWLFDIADCCTPRQSSSASCVLQLLLFSISLSPHAPCFFHSSLFLQSQRPRAARSAFTSRMWWRSPTPSRARPLPGPRLT